MVRGFISWDSQTRYITESIRECAERRAPFFCAPEGIVILDGALHCAPVLRDIVFIML